MQTDRPLDGVDSRFALTVYAAVMWVVGVFIALWGSLWVSAPALNGVPFGASALVRVVGSVIIAFACVGTATARISDPVDQSRCVGWLGAGHFVVFIVAVLQNFAIWANPLGGRLVLIVALPAVWLNYARQKRDGDGPNGLIPRRRFRKVEDRRLRSAYEENIRKAAVQEERSRLARDLHDSIKQQLFVVQMSAATAQARLESNTSEVGTALVQIRESTRDALTEMDTMLDQLRAAPLENAGLVSALQKLAEATSIRTGVDVHCEFGDLPPSETFPPGTHAELLRIAQEALSNVARHARASHVTLALRKEDMALVLHITDDGKGFGDAEKNQGMGLRNMKERAEELGGGLSLTSVPGRGSEVVAAVPMTIPPTPRFTRKVTWSILFVALWAFLLGSGSNGNPNASNVKLVLLPLGLAAVFDLIRYLYAWRKARRLPLATA